MSPSSQMGVEPLWLGWVDVAERPGDYWGIPFLFPWPHGLETHTLGDAQFAGTLLKASDFNLP